MKQCAGCGTLISERYIYCGNPCTEPEDVKEDVAEEEEVEVTSAEQLDDEVLDSGEDLE